MPYFFDTASFNSEISKLSEFINPDGITKDRENCIWAEFGQFAFNLISKFGIMPTNKERPEVKKLFKASSERLNRIKEATKIIKELHRWPNQFGKQLINRIYHQLIWHVTEADGKYSTRFRSVLSTSNKSFKIEHEHVFTVKQVKNEIMSNHKKANSILNEKAVACVVTESEHRKLNKFGESLNGWERYKAAGIEIKDMKTNKIIGVEMLIKGLVTFLLLIIPFLTTAQEIPCRQWYFNKDKYGNETKSSCKEAWQVNTNGQKHGKYIAYYENGNPGIVTTYLNGKLNGKYKEFKHDGTSITVEGTYNNGKKNGSWKEDGTIGQYLNGEPIGLWKFGESSNPTRTEYNYSTNELNDFWKGHQLVGRLDFENKTFSGEILVGWAFTKAVSVYSVKTNYLEMGINGRKESTEIEKNEATGDISFGANYNGPNLRPNLRIEKDRLTYILKVIRENFNLLKNETDDYEIFITLKFKNNEIQKDVESRVFNSEGKQLQSFNFFRPFEEMFAIDIKKRDNYLDSCQKVFNQYAAENKLIYSNYVKAEELINWFSGIIKEIKALKPEPFTKKYLASIEKELEGSMLSLSPSRYSGIVKIDENILNILIDADMLREDKNVSLNIENYRTVLNTYYLQYNIKEGKFDGEQIIGEWDNSNDRMSRFNFTYNFSNGKKISYKDPNKSYTYDDKGEARNYYALFSDIIINSRRDWAIKAEDWEAFRSYRTPEELFKRYMTGKFSWARDTVYFYVFYDLELTCRSSKERASNDKWIPSLFQQQRFKEENIKLAGLFHKQAVADSAKREYYQHFDWLISLTEGKIDKAYQEIQNNLSLDSFNEDPLTHFNKAIIELLLSKHENSIATLLKIDYPAMTYINFLLAINYSMVGDKLNSKVYLKKFVDNYPNYHVTQDFVSLLSSYGFQWKKCKFIESYRGSSGTQFPSIKYESLKAFLEK